MGTLQDPTLFNCMAYAEYERTKGLSAFSWVAPVQSVQTLNQYCTKTLFLDGSYILISNHTNKVNLERMTAYTRLKEGIAIRTLYGSFTTATELVELLPLPELDKLKEKAKATADKEREARKEKDAKDKECFEERKLEVNYNV